MISIVLLLSLAYLAFLKKTKIIWSRYEQIGYMIIHVAIMFMVVEYIELKWGLAIVIAYMCVVTLAVLTLFSSIPRGGRLAISTLVTLFESLCYWVIAQEIMFTFARSRDSVLLQNLFSIPVIYLNWHLAKSLGPIFDRYREIKLQEFEEEHYNSDGTTRASDITLAHLSDLHLSESTTLEGNVSPGDSLCSLRSVLEKVSLANPEVVVVTGDVTDQGSSTEWDMFYDELVRYNLNNKVVVVPGNHDININSLYYPSWENSQFSLKCYNFMVKSLNRTTGGVVRGVGNVVELAAVMYNLAPFLQMYEECYNKTNTYTRSQVEEMRKRVVEAFNNVGLEIDFADESVEDIFRAILEGIFPIEYSFGDINVIAINSCTYRSVSIWDCGFGKIGEKQMIKLAAIQQHTPYTQKIVYAMHHSPGLPRRQSDTSYFKRHFRDFENKSLALVDSVDLLRTISGRRHSILMHGHVHMSYHCVYSDTHILSAPSALYGDKADTENLMHLYNLDTFKSGVKLEKAESVRSKH